MKLRSILALLCALPAALEAQSIHGRVLDAASGEAVPEATVQVTGADRQAVRTRARADGGFTLPLKGPGTYRVRVERTGYAPATSQEVEIAAGEAVQVEMRISAQPLTLAPLTVVGRQAPRRIASLEPTGFYNREARGHGRFLKREDLERRRGNRLVNILDEVPGVRLYRDRRGNEYVTFDRAQASGALSRAQRGEADLC
ncbi:MAG TPA: carboxypeptidase-like regulatory domain-containing protein, partial [Longimicrobium sp.]